MAAGRSRVSASAAAALARPQLRTGNNSINRDVLSMPDNWEFPWYAAWDHAFHMVAIAEVDPALQRSN